MYATGYVGSRTDGTRKSASKPVFLAKLADGEDEYDVQKLFMSELELSQLKRENVSGFSDTSIAEIQAARGLFVVSIVNLYIYILHHGVYSHHFPHFFFFFFLFLLYIALATPPSLCPNALQCTACMHRMCTASTPCPNPFFCKAENLTPL